MTRTARVLLLLAAAGVLAEAQNVRITWIGQFTVADGRPVPARTQMTAAQMPFVLLPGWHDDQKGLQRGRWTQSGVVFAHMGDFGEDQLSDEQLASLPSVERAAALVKRSKPRDPLVYKPSRVTVNRTTLPASAQIWVTEADADVAAVNAASSAPRVPVAPGMAGPWQVGMVSNQLSVAVE